MTMNLTRRTLLGGIMTGVAATALPAHATVDAAPAAPNDHIVLWPEGVPAAIPPTLEQRYIERSKDPAIADRILIHVTAPFVERVAPTAPANGAAIVIMPGGGYRGMAWDKEGVDIANWFAAQGVTAFILGYRLPRDGWAGGPEAPLIDAQRAMRVIAHNAHTWGVDPARIAVLGFSAGGHLGINLGAQFANELYAPVDAIDTASARPAMVAGIYPAVSLIGTAETLFQQPLDDAFLAKHSPHLHVADNAPPHFLLHAEDDPIVKPEEHTLLLRAALKAKAIEVETHLYAKGGHGFAMRLTKGLSVDGWPDRVMTFGRSIGWV